MAVLGGWAVSYQRGTPSEVGTTDVYGEHDDELADDEDNGEVIQSTHTHIHTHTHSLSLSLACSLVRREGSGGTRDREGRGRVDRFGFCSARRSAVRFRAKREQLKGLEDVYLRAKARVWP